MRNRKIYRRERPRTEDRARDDDAGGRLLMNHQISADRQHGRLQHHPHDLGGSTKPAGDVAGALVAVQIVLIGFRPAPGQPAGHSHRNQHFGIAPAGRRQIVAPRRQPQRLTRRGARQKLGHDGERHQNDRADQRSHADQHVEGKADRQVKWQPWQVEERARSHATEKAAHIVEVAQRLKALIAAANGQRQAHHDIEHPRIERLVERSSDAAEDSAADQVEDTLRGIEEACQEDQTHQGRNAAARQHPVIDLEHEQRPGQIEQVDHAAHDADADKGAAAGAQRFTEFGTPDTGSGCHLS